MKNTVWGNSTVGPSLGSAWGQEPVQRTGAENQLGPSVEFHPQQVDRLRESRQERSILSRPLKALGSIVYLSPFPDPSILSSSGMKRKKGVLAVSLTRAMNVPHSAGSITKHVGFEVDSEWIPYRRESRYF